MPLTEALRLALQAIWTSKLRSFFTLLGLLCGCPGVRCVGTPLSLSTIS